MPSTEILNQIKDAADRASVAAEEYSGIVGTVKGYIVDNFGQNGLIASYVLLGVISLLLVAKVGKLTLTTLKFLVIPSIVLAILATFFLHASFLIALPVTVTCCSLFLLFKG
jgi:hypothetical protein